MIQFMQTIDESTTLGTSLFHYIPLVACFAIGLTAIFFMIKLSFAMFKKEKRKFCIVLASIFCIGIPIGTVLGALTIFGLTRNSIKEDFSS